ncbi:MAG: cold shock domain-containing protein [Patescibacteria group bacterium]|nr:cold shock domain-containing protein [Patescibacteria group bacterium]
MNVPSISGVAISIYNLNKEDEISIDPDGYLGTVDSMDLVDLKSTPQRWQSLLIELVIDPNAQIWGFNVTENADVVPARDWRAKPADEEDPAHNTPEGSRIYRRLVPVTESELMTVATTKYPNNNLRLLESLGDGYFQLWSVGIATQSGEFFLVVEKMYQPFRCYRSGETVVCPSYMGSDKRPGWVPFITLLNRVLKGEDFEALPPIKEVRNEKSSTKPKMNGISEGEGRVVWFSHARQYGMLMTKQGPARIHWREIDRPGARRRHLNDGEKVTFEALNKPHLTNARDTGFKLEAVGVTLKEENK